MELDELLEEIKGKDRKVKFLETSKIEVRKWVRLKCKYGCKAYGKHLTCPPFTPKASETKELIQEYNKACLIKFENINPNEDISYEHIHHYLWDEINYMHNKMVEFEEKAFLNDFYKAFAFVGLPCTFCEECIPEKQEVKNREAIKNKCKHPEKVRPSMEGCGIDAFKTAKKAGFELNVLKNPEQEINFLGLLLLE